MAIDRIFNTLFACLGPRNTIIACPKRNSSLVHKKLVGFFLLEPFLIQKHKTNNTKTPDSDRISVK